MHVATSGTLELTGEERAIARSLLAVLDEADRSSARRAGAGPPRFRSSELRRRLLKDRVFGDPSRLLGRLKRRGLLEEGLGGPTDRVYSVPFPVELREVLITELQPPEVAEPGGFHPVPDERSEIRSMDSDFLTHLQDLLRNRFDATVAFGRGFSAAKLATYLRDLFGEALYLDILISMLQQYALADVPLLAPTGRSTGSTGFHLAFFGPPGTGKTFAIDDMIRGNSRSAVPAHGLPGRNRYCGGITPAQFLRVGAYYSGRTFNFIVPEFNDWFKYRGMVEPLKLVMEQREVKWETTLGTVGPYTFHSFFSVNYNVRTAGASDYWTTIADPNFAALEDRMLLRFHQMTRDRFRAVEASAERLELGEIDFSLAEKVRDHLTLIYAAQTGHPLVAGRLKTKPVRLDPGLYRQLRQVSEAALAGRNYPRFSPRLKSRAVKLAAAAAIVGYFRHEPDATLAVGPEETELARSFYEEEIRVREGRRGIAR